MSVILDYYLINTLLGRKVMPNDSSIVSAKLPVSYLGASRKAGQGDDGYIVGKVTEQGVPVSRRVMCYHRVSGVLVRTVRSDTSGDYRIDGLLKNTRYYITSIDEIGTDIQYNAVTQDLITASEVVK